MFQICGGVLAVPTLMRIVERKQHGSAQLLRYRFDSTEQVARHFHVAAGRVVLFYPTLLKLEPGERVILEVAFTASEQHCMVRGNVLGRESATQLGWWLEFSTQGLVSGLRAAAASPKRRHRRFPLDTIINIERSEGLPVVARLVDVCAGGGRVIGAPLKASPGDGVRLRLYARDDRPDTIIPAEIAWVRGPELGIHFRPAAGERIAIAAVVEDARKRLVAAHEIAHPAICRCAEGQGVVEPPMPRSAHRHTGSR